MQDGPQPPKIFWRDTKTAGTRMLLNANKYHQLPELVGAHPGLAVLLWSLAHLCSICGRCLYISSEGLEDKLRTHRPAQASAFEAKELFT